MGSQLLEFGDQLVVDDRRLVQIRPAVHHAMPHRDQAVNVAGQLVEHDSHCRRVVRNLSVADAFDDPIDRLLARIRINHSVFERRRARVEYEDAAHRPCAWIAVIATVLTMSSTKAPRDRSLTGLFSPCSTGPIAIAPALRCTAL